MLSRRAIWTLTAFIICATGLVRTEFAAAQEPPEPVEEAPAIASAPPTFLVSPPAVLLRGNFAQAQLIVTERDGSGRVHAASPDLTHAVSYVSSQPAVVTVSPGGKLVAMANGHASIVIQHASATMEIPVTVSNVVSQPAIDYSQQVIPILSKAGCSMGACHAAQHGQGGFKLSVFGFDPSADWNMIARDRDQRRINPLDPGKSLFLEKPTMTIAHGGGQRLERGSVDYQMLAAWIAAGTPGPVKDAATVTGMTVTPWGRTGRVGLDQQLRVEAVYSDNTSRDVTSWAKFDSLDDSVLQVTKEGRVRVVGQGQTAVLVRYEGQAEVVQFIIPHAESIALAGWQSHNYVDELAVAKFRELGIEPAALCDDATFLRRAMFDAIGTLPTPAETQAFLQSTDEHKREKLVDRLLGLTGDPQQDIYNDAYAAYWALRWSDLIRNDSRKVGDQGMWAMHNWIRESFRVNKPFDKFVTELITAKGSIFSNGPANFFRINGNNTDLTEATAQTFLGIRMECAKCHHHPFEKYGQEDYYQLAAFFSRVTSKSSQEFGLFGGETVIMVRDTGEVSHPRTGKILKPTVLDGQEMENELDRRIPLAEWLTSPENRLFARSVVNRYVRFLLGQGLVEPVDDMRATNPASNPALLDALARDFASSGYNLKHLTRAIMVSRLYQLDSQPTGAADSQGRFYSFYQVKRLAAEPLLDAIDRATGTQTKFTKLPLGTRAIELPDAQYGDYFLNVFAKPLRASLCECERSPDENLAQALHTLNGEVLASKIAAGDGRIAKLLETKVPHETIVEEIYLATLNRPPSEAELAASQTFLAESPSPKECYEDLLWALLNSKHFLFVH